MERKKIKKSVKKDEERRKRMEGGEGGEDRVTRRMEVCGAKDRIRGGLMK